jgi:hypothetical protein
MTTRKQSAMDQPVGETMPEHLQTNATASVDQEAHSEIRASIEALQKEVRQLRTDLQRFMLDKTQQAAS